MFSAEHQAVIFWAKFLLSYAKVRRQRLVKGDKQVIISLHPPRPPPRPTPPFRRIRPHALGREALRDSSPRDCEAVYHMI